MEHPESPATAHAFRTLSQIRDGLASGRLPVVPQVLELIRAIAQRADTISVQQLADLIAQDPGVMGRIISIANKLAYNPGGAEIATIQQAISVVGYERIRNLTVSVMLLENAESALSGEENREVAGIALASGFLARELFLETGLIDPETAFVCAALRNYGKLLLATFMFEDYNRARALALEVGSSKAFREVFGLTPLELGRELLESEQLPPVILDTMRQADRDEVRRQSASPLEQLVAVSEFSVQVFELFEQSDLTPERFEARALRLARDHVPHLKLSPSHIRDHVHQVSLRCQEIAGSSGLQALRTPLFQRLSALDEGRELPPASTLSRRLDAQAVAAARTATIGRALQSGADLLARLIQADQPDLPRLFAALIEMLREHLRLQETVVFLTNTDLVTAAARYGNGPIFQALRNRTVISRQQRDVFALCLARGEDILLDNVSNPRLRDYIPGWLLGVAGRSPLVLLPLKDAQGVFGILLGIAQDQEALALFDRLRQDLGKVRTVLSKAGPLIRAGTPETTQ